MRASLPSCRVRLCACSPSCVRHCAAAVREALTANGSGEQKQRRHSAPADATATVTGSGGAHDEAWDGVRRGHCVDTRQAHRTHNERGATHRRMRAGGSATAPVSSERTRSGPKYHRNTAHTTKSTGEGVRIAARQCQVERAAARHSKVGVKLGAKRCRGEQTRCLVVETIDTESRAFCILQQSSSGHIGRITSITGGGGASSTALAREGRRLQRHQRGTKRRMSERKRRSQCGEMRRGAADGRARSDSDSSVPLQLLPSRGMTR